MNIVKTTGGLVEGVSLKGPYKDLVQYRGIPFALPPVAELRWKPPVKPQGWAGVKKCHEFASCAPQFPHDPSESEKLIMSEDCLYLNITTQAVVSGENRPVFVWFHGGGLTHGTSYDEFADPREFAKRGVTVVQIAQRLSVFGYLSLPQLSAECNGKSGNYGLMDQMMGFQWVLDNIKEFGGDPDNITIGGDSGGTVKCCVIASIPAFQGKIKRVMNFSGLQWLRSLPTMAEAEEKGCNYLETIGLDPDISIDELRKMSTGEVFKNVPLTILPGEMVCDGDLIPQNMRENFDTYLSNVDFMNCTTCGEADVFAREGFFTGDKKKIETADEFYQHFQDILGELYTKYDFEKIVKVSNSNAGYTAARLASLGLSKRGRVNCMRSLMVNRIFGLYMSQRYPGSRVYSRFFSLPQPLEAGKKDPVPIGIVPHGSDVWYDFASMRTSGTKKKDWRKIDLAVSDLCIAYDVNFIRTGNPNSVGLPFWPMSGDDYGYLEISETAEAYQGFSDELSRLVKEFTEKEYDIIFTEK